MNYADHFWGDAHHGYHVLYERFKSGEEAAQECEVFVKEAQGMQDEMVRLLSKQMLRVSSFSSSSQLSSSCWLMAKGTLDLMTEIQSAYARNLHELAKEVGRYRTELSQSKKRVKEDGVVETVSLMQTTTTCLQKSKETYATRYVELEKLRTDSSASAKELAKAEQKLTRARDECRAYVVKYEAVRTEFEEKMNKAAEMFQAHDRAHLTTLKNFLLAYSGHQQEAAAAGLQVSSQFRESLQEVSVDDLLNKFIKEKATGTERPQPASFESLETTVGGRSPQLPSGSSQSAVLPSSTDPSHHSDSLSQEGVLGQAPPAQVMDLLTMDFDTVTVGGGMEREKEENKEDKEPPPSIMSASFSASLGGSRQKLSNWLPGKRKKTTSMCSSNESGEVTEGGGGFLNKFSRGRRSANKSKTDIPAAVAGEGGTGFEDTFSTASSSKSEDKPQCLLTSTTMGPSEPTVDEEGFTIRSEQRDEDEDREKGRMHKESWASCSSSSDEEDENDLQQSKIRSLHIRPAESAPKMNASVDELRDAIGSISLARSNTFDRDPWSASTSARAPFTQSLGPGAFSLKSPLRPAHTGGDEQRARFNESEFSRSNVPLNFSASLSFGPGMARARPRSHTQQNAGGDSLAGSTSQLAASLTGDGRLQRHESNDWGGQNTSLNDSMCNLSGSTVNLMQATIAEQRVPIAVALNEYVHVWMKGADTESRTTRVFGTLLVSFAASSFALLTDKEADVEPLQMRMDDSETGAPIKTIVPNKQLLTSSDDDGGRQFVFDRPLLSNWLNSQRKQKPAAAFFNVEVLRYELSEASPAANTPPLNFNVYWKTTMLQDAPEGTEQEDGAHDRRSHVDIRVDYRLNEESVIKAPLLNVVFSTRLNAPSVVASVVSEPLAEWDAPNCTLNWRLSELTKHGASEGSLKARVYLGTGSPAPQPSQTSVQFQANDSSISQAAIKLMSSDMYHVSMVRRKVHAGKYFADPQVRV